jgi:hypothetical protein
MIIQCRLFIPIEEKKNGRLAPGYFCLLAFVHHLVFYNLEKTNVAQHDCSFHKQSFEMI